MQLFSADTTIRIAPKRYIIPNHSPLFSLGKTSILLTFAVTITYLPHLVNILKKRPLTKMNAPMIFFTIWSYRKPPSQLQFGANKLHIF